ncbi:MAG: DNA repair protein RecN [Candidatus Desulforudis sp.]|nr:DNA repair protein RecN [Desulforudis sp.]
MLHRLVVRDFALIDDLTVEFGSGFNVLTGETGTGKSLLVDALQVVLGRRVSADYVRTGADRAYLEAVFDLQERDVLREPFTAAGIEPEEGFLALSRELLGSGRSLYRINGRTVSHTLFLNLGQRLVDFHGQGEQQSLLREGRHGELLDRSGGPELRETVRRLEQAFRDWAAARKALEAHRAEAMERARRLDIVELQVGEIERARLEVGEEEQLHEERSFLVNVEQIARLADESYQALYGSDEDAGAAVAQIGRALDNLHILARLCREAQEGQETLKSTLSQVQEVARDLVAVRERAQFDPERMNAVEERLALIEKLKRKYGATVEEVLVFQEAAAAERDRLLGGEAETARLQESVTALHREWETLASEVSRLRREAARELETRVTTELRELELGSVEFRVELRSLSGTSVRGREEAVFLFSANPGEPPKPLVRIASGGELSRIMLALKTVLAAVDETPTLIFDEVDAGIGGRALQAVAEKLFQIGRGRQVVCVTHAAQIACHADRHLEITKEVVGTGTRTSITVLEEPARLEELARMLGGGREITEVARKHAAELRHAVAKQRSC